MREIRRKKWLVKAVRSTQRIATIVLFWLLSFAVLYCIYLVIFVQPYFEVKKIEVQGDLSRLSPEIVRQLARIEGSANLFGTSVSKVKENILKNKWVKEIAVRRELPNVLKIYVKEFRPVAIANLDRLYFVDEEGTLFKEVEAGDPKDYPVFSGFELLGNDLNYAATVKHLKEFLNVKRIYENERVGEALGLSEIHYDPRNGYTIITYQPAVVIRTGYSGFREKLSKLEAVLPVITRHANRIQYVDVNYERKVIVKYGA